MGISTRPITRTKSRQRARSRAQARTSQARYSTAARREAARVCTPYMQPAIRTVARGVPLWHSRQVLAHAKRCWDALGVPRPERKYLLRNLTDKYFPRYLQALDESVALRREAEILVNAREKTLRFAYAARRSAFLEHKRNPASPLRNESLLADLQAALTSVQNYSDTACAAIARWRQTLSRPFGFIFERANYLLKLGAHDFPFNEHGVPDGHAELGESELLSAAGAARVSTPDRAGARAVGFAPPDPAPLFSPGSQAFYNVCFGGDFTNTPLMHMQALFGPESEWLRLAEAEEEVARAIDKETLALERRGKRIFTVPIPLGSTFVPAEIFRFHAKRGNAAYSARTEGIPLVRRTQTEGQTGELPATATSAYLTAHAEDGVRYLPPRVRRTCPAERGALSAALPPIS